MKGKRGLVLGVANDKSIAWGIARQLAEEGAELAFTYQGEAFGKRLAPLAESVGATLTMDADVQDDASLDRAFETIEKEWGTLDFLVHAIAFAEKEDLTGRFWCCHWRGAQSLSHNGSQRAARGQCDLGGGWRHSGLPALGFRCLYDRRGHLCRRRLPHPWNGERREPLNLPQGFGFTLFLVGIVSYLCYKCLEGGFAPNKGENAQTNITPKAILLAILSFGAAIFVLGPIAGIAIVLGTAALALGWRPHCARRYLWPLPATQSGPDIDHERGSGPVGALRPTTAHLYCLYSGLFRRPPCRSPIQETAPHDRQSGV